MSVTCDMVMGSVVGGCSVEKAQRKSRINCNKLKYISVGEPDIGNDPNYRIRVSDKYCFA
jgi:hypothetical protein